MNWPPEGRAMRGPLALCLLLLLLLASGCTKRETDEKVWVEIEPVQCQGNPWEHLEKDYNSEETALTAYYARNGIEIYGLEHLQQTGLTCLACACPRGDKYRLQVDAKHKEDVFYWPVRPAQEEENFFEITVSPDVVEPGSEFLVTVRHRTLKPIFYGGCNDFAVETGVNGAWIVVDRFVKRCMWEGLPKTVEPQSILESVVDFVDIPGKHRLKFELGVDCESGKALSQAGCRLQVPLYSNEFQVKPWPEVAETEIKRCVDASDCVSVAEGCCDCVAGGKNTAIHRKYQQYWAWRNEAACLGNSCPLVASQDPRCGVDLRPDCVEGVCVLQSKATAATGTGVPFRKIALGFYVQGFSELEVFRDSDHWATSWATLQEKLKPKPPVPAVDFSQKMVLGVFMSRITTGEPYALEIKNVTESQGQLVVEYAKRPLTMQEREATKTFAPYFIIEVPKTDKEVKAVEVPPPKVGGSA